MIKLDTSLESTGQNFFFIGPTPLHFICQSDSLFHYSAVEHFFALLNDQAIARAVLTAPLSVDISDFLIADGDAALLHQTARLAAGSGQATLDQQ